MSRQIGLDRTYRQMMKNHPFGYALYKPVRQSSMKPGTCGYFDNSGFWTKLFDLNDSLSLSRHDLGDALDTKSELRDSGITWDPKLSVGVHKVDVGLEAGVNTGLPVDIGTELKVVTSTDFGAVLVTTPNIYHHRVYQESDIRPWWSRNKNKLLKAKFKYEIAQHGLFIVTGTYTTSKCSITAWSDTSNDVYLGFKSDVAGLPVGARVHGGWVLGESASGWNHYDAPSGDRYVVFMTGFLFKPHQIFSHVFTSTKSDNDMRTYGEDNQGGLEGRRTRVEDLDFVCERVAEQDETEDGKTSREPSRWAVLVGIDEYIKPKDDTKPPIQNLRGCVADANAMWIYFSKTLGMEDEYIRTLTAPTLEDPKSELPTKQKIVDAIKETCDKAAPKDLVYIHFSGHRAHLKKGEQYVLVPTDVKEKTGGVLRATEIKNLLCQMLEKELIVTVVLDCCHSSGISHGGRSHETTPPEAGGADEVAVRGLDDLDSMLGEENIDKEFQSGEVTDIDQLLEFDGNDGEGRSLSTAEHWLVPSGGEYTMIAACRELENAYEMKTENGKWQGALTFCIDRLLRNTEALVHGLPGLSYWRLQWHVAEAVQQQLGMSRQQNVLIKGAMHRCFFGDSELEVSDAPVIIELNERVALGNRVLLSTSEHLGARVGSTFEIYPLTNVGVDDKGQTLDRLAVCTIKAAENLRDGNAEAVWTEISPGCETRIIVGCPAVPQGEIFVRLVKATTGCAAEMEAADHEAIRKAWRSSTSTYAKLVSDDFKGPTSVQIAINEERSEYQILDRKGEVLFTLAFRPGDETASVALVKHTMHLARFYSALEMSTGSLSKSLVKMHVLGRISANGEASTRKICTINMQQTPVPDYVKPWDGFEADGDIIFQPGDILALAIDNVTKDEMLHVALICLDMSNWSIVPLHPTAKMGNTTRLGVPIKLEPEHRLLVPILYEPPKGSPKQSEAHKEMLKVLAATSSRDFNVLLLSSMDEACRGDYDESSEGGFWSLFEGIVEQDRPLRAGSMRQTVQFDIRERILKVMPTFNECEKGMDWEAALDDSDVDDTE